MLASSVKLGVDTIWAFSLSSKNDILEVILLIDSAK